MKAQELKSKPFKRAESNLLNKLNNVFLKYYPHHVMPGYNLNRSPGIEEWGEESALGLYQEFPYSCDLPKPLLPPAKLSRTVLDEEDPALQLLNLKSHLKDDLNRIMKYYEGHKKEFNAIRKKSIKWKRSSDAYKADVPKYIADIAELFDMDPDPYFEGTYNWYYTGGSLNYVQINDWDVLLFPFMEDLVAAHIIPMEDFIWKPLLQNSAKCKLPELLYEIRQSKISDTCRILGRHKNQCTIYTLSNSDNHLLLNEVHRQASKEPYVSVDLSSTNINLHCTLNAERILSLWDINNVNYISRGSVLQNNTKRERDVWGCIRFQETDPNVLIYVDRCCLHYIDTRTALNQACITLCPKFNLEICESLSVEASSKHNSCRYLGTYHSFLLCDNRSPKQCVRQKWTHQFKDTPLLATVINSYDKEIIVLSSQTAGENTIILNTWTNEENSHSFNLPFTPPYIAETLNESQKQGMCLNPYLRSRFELCNTGSTLITNVKNGVSYFVQNSIGDIFYQCITHEKTADKFLHSPLNGKACYALNMWEKALSAQAEPLVPLAFTDKCNMEYIYENFRNKRLNPRLKSTENNEQDDFEPSWKQSLAKLGSYIDLLAPELLAAWEIREEESVPVETRPHQKVLNWLESSTLNDPIVESQNEPEYVTPTPINTQELNSVSQEHDLMYIDDSDMLQEMLLPKVKSGITCKRKHT